MSSIDQRAAVQVLEDAIVKQNVLRGIALLEEKYGPDWAKCIDLDSLDLADSRSCVLGQLYDEAEVSDEQVQAFDRSVWARSHGSDFGDTDTDGYARGLAIIDGPLTAKSDGPEWYGFDSMELWLSHMIEMSDLELEDLGVTRQMVEAAIAEEANANALVGARFVKLDERWEREILKRR